MTKWVWISDVAEPSVEVSASDGPGRDWQRIGMIDTGSETELWHAVQRHLGQRGGRDRAVALYILAEASDWVERALHQSESGVTAWLAIDVYGNKQRYLLSRRQATFAMDRGTRRPPETHPGLVGTWHQLPTRITPETGRGLFKSISADA